jgi:hypothetical protein
MSSYNPKLHALGAQRDSPVVCLPGSILISEVDMHLNQHHVKLREVGEHVHGLQDQVALGIVIT